MDRRQFCGAVGAGVGAVGAFATATATTRADEPDKHEHGHHHPEHVKLLSECAQACNEASSHCLGELEKENSENRSQHAKAHRFAMDCQAFCSMSAALTARMSPLALYAHQACAEACRCCAEACENGKDEVMKTCAEKCRECERACRAITKMMEVKRS